MRSNSAVSLVGGSKRKAAPFAMNGPGAERGAVSAVLIVRRSFNDDWWALDVRTTHINCFACVAAERVFGPSGAFPTQWLQGSMTVRLLKGHLWTHS